MLPGAASFSGAHRRVLEEPGSVEFCPAGVVSPKGHNEVGSGSLERSGGGTNCCCQETASQGQKSSVAFSYLLFSL